MGSAESHTWLLTVFPASVPVGIGAAPNQGPPCSPAQGTAVLESRRMAVGCTPLCRTDAHSLEGPVGQGLALPLPSLFSPFAPSSFLCRPSAPAGRGSTGEAPEPMMSPHPQSL